MNIKEKLSIYNEQRLANFRKKLVKNDINSISEILIELDKSANELKNKFKEVDFYDKDTIYSIRKEISDYRNLYKKTLELINLILRDKKYKFIIVIFLKSNQFKCFEIYENTKIKGFKYNNEYYNISQESVIEQNQNRFLFYKENISSPLNWKTIKITEESVKIDLDSSNLLDVVEGKTLKGLFTLGKDSGFAIDWKYAIAGIGIIVLAVLHLTGTIDLGQMLSLK